jgi:hypothetical protein
MGAAGPVLTQQEHEEPQQPATFSGRSQAEPSATTIGGLHHPHAHAQQPHQQQRRGGLAALPPAEARVRAIAEVVNGLIRGVQEGRDVDLNQLKAEVRGRTLAVCVYGGARWPCRVACVSRQEAASQRDETPPPVCPAPRPAPAPPPPPHLNLLSCSQDPFTLSWQ